AGQGGGEVREQGGDRRGPAARRPDVVHGWAGERDGLQELLGVWPQRAAGRREREPVPLAAALEEAHVERILERADARAHRRLREPQRGGGAAEAAERPDRQERLDLRDFHQRSIPGISGVINIFYTGDKNYHVALFTRDPHSGGHGASA